MRFDVGNLARAETPAIIVRHRDHRRLAFAARCGELAFRAAVVVERAATQHGVHVVAIG